MSCVHGGRAPTARSDYNLAGHSDQAQVCDTHAGLFVCGHEDVWLWRNVIEVAGLRCSTNPDASASDRHTDIKIHL